MPLSSKWSLIHINRTRDENIIEAADIVFDVGGIYDPTNGRFDHHQNEYSGPLSSAGMMLQWLTESGWIPTSRHSTEIRIGVMSTTSTMEESKNDRLFLVLVKMINIFNASADTLEEFDAQFIQRCKDSHRNGVGFESQFNQEQSC